MNSRSDVLLVGNFGDHLGVAEVTSPRRAPADSPRRDRGERVRRFESGDTTRLNSAHWSAAVENPINLDLQTYLETLRTRCLFEAANNPIVEGVIGTYANDVSGEDGPLLRVQSDDAAWNSAAEEVWRLWWSRPTIDGKRSGADLLRLWVQSLWKTGEFLAQKTTDPSAESTVRLRLKPVPSRRLSTPIEYSSDANVVLGVRLTVEGRPTHYYVAQPDRWGAYELTGTYQEIPAADLIHEFLAIEEDQVRGIPWLASSLQQIADMRDYDAQVLDAARQAADMAVFWYTDHPDAAYIEVNESLSIERRTQSTGPPGWKPQQLTPQQPSATYSDYRHERMAEIGRPRGMPLMMVRLDSRQHNYSSARFDAQIYHRGIKVVQNWISGTPQSRGVLNDLLDAVLREAELAGEIGPKPDAVRYCWVWPVPPHVDPQKEALAEETRLRTGTLSYSDALAAHGLDRDAVIDQRAKDAADLTVAGLPPIGTTPNVPAPTAGGREDEEESDDADK